MYSAQATSPKTTLSSSITTSSTTINVQDGSVLPDAPNLLTIGFDTNQPETVLMTAKVGNALTVTRNIEGYNSAWSAGVSIARVFTAKDWNDLKTEFETAQTDINTNSVSITSHTGDIANPHGVTKAQIGLSSVDNTSDANKPISNAQAAVNSALQGEIDLNTAKVSFPEAPADGNQYARKNNGWEQVSASGSGLSNWYDVTDYGATGDGTTDDLTAIQNAINAAETAGGGVVYFPPPSVKYLVSDDITPKDDIHYLGVKSEIYMASRVFSNTGAIFRNASGLNNCTFEGLKLTSVNDQSGEVGSYYESQLVSYVTGITSPGSSNITIIHCDFDQLLYGTKLDTTTNTKLNFDYVNMTNCMTCMYFSFSTNVRINNTYLDSTGATNTHLHNMYMSLSCSDFALSNVQFNNTAGAGIHVYHTATKAMDTMVADNCTFKGVNVGFYINRDTKNFTATNFVIKDTDNPIMVDVSCENLLFDGGTVEAVDYLCYLENSENIKLSNILVDCSVNVGGNYLFNGYGDKYTYENIKVYNMTANNKIIYASSNLLTNFLMEGCEFYWDTAPSGEPVSVRSGSHTALFKNNKFVNNGTLYNNVTYCPTGGEVIFRNNEIKGFKDTSNATDVVVVFNTYNYTRDAVEYAKEQREYRGTAAPVAVDPTGDAYKVGDRVINTTPSASGFYGWICTTAGSPGTWTEFAYIGAPGGSGDMTKAVYDPTNVNADAFARTNHTGTQTASTISDFDTEVSNNPSVTANTAKVTFPEAPQDGNQYARKDAGWEQVASSGTSDHTIVLVPDDATVDTADEITAFLTTNNGKKVRFPKNKTYNLDKQVKADTLSYMDIDFNGCTFALANNPTHPSITVGSYTSSEPTCLVVGDCTTVRFRNLKLDGNALNVTNGTGNCQGIVVATSTNVFFDNMWFDDINYHCFVQWSGCVNLRCENFYMNECRGIISASYFYCTTNATDSSWFNNIYATRDYFPSNNSYPTEATWSNQVFYIDGYNTHISNVYAKNVNTVLDYRKGVHTFSNIKGDNVGRLLITQPQSAGNEPYVYGDNLVGLNVFGAYGSNCGIYINGCQGLAINNIYLEMDNTHSQATTGIRFGSSQVNKGVNLQDVYIKDTANRAIWFFNSDSYSIYIKNLEVDQASNYVYYADGTGVNHVIDGYKWYQTTTISDTSGIVTLTDNITTEQAKDQNTGNLKFWSGTQAQYDAIGTKDANTIYFVE